MNHFLCCNLYDLYISQKTKKNVSETLTQIKINYKNILFFTYQFYGPFKKNPLRNLLLFQS